MFFRFDVKGIKEQNMQKITTNNPASDEKPIKENKGTLVLKPN